MPDAPASQLDPDIASENAPAPQPASQPALNPAQKRRLGWELLLIIIAVWLPHFYLSIHYVLLPPTSPSHLSFGDQEFWEITATLRSIAIVLLVLMLAGVDWQTHGFKRLSMKDLLFTILACAAVYVVRWVAGYWIPILLGPFFRDLAGLHHNAGVPGKIRPEGGFEHLILAFQYLLGGFSEELFFRAYLLPRWKLFSGSIVKAVIFSTVLFALVHIYQGAYAFIRSGVFGLMFACLFLWSRRVLPISIGHAFNNLSLYAGI